jgi:uncharacterized protein (TIGR03067 family)
MKRLLPIVVCCLVALAAVHGQTQAQKPQDPKAMSRELTSLQGTWIFTQANGQDIPAGSELTFTITGDQYAGTGQGNVEHGTITLDTSKKPIAITLSIKDGDDAGKTQYGVVQVGEGTITLKLGQAGAGDRPTDLETTDGFVTLSGVKKKTS